MMTGGVVSLHALLPVRFRQTGRPDVEIEFVVDTGFTGELTLPIAAVAAMGMPLLHRIPADLADDSTVELDVHFATVVWHGQERLVRVIATGRRPLLGTALLDESKLSIKFREGGQVTVQAL